MPEFLDASVLLRYLLRVTRDSHYGDSMERMMYNTVLGARSMLPDGRAFYYQDCNFSGKKVYSTHRFPCCSGTLPQVATDYRINSYFHDDRGIFVNLYLASRVRWQHDSALVEIKQDGDYPFGDTVHFELTTSKAKDFALHLRIPQWAEDVPIRLVRAPSGPLCSCPRRWPPSTGAPWRRCVSLTRRFRPVPRSGLPSAHRTCSGSATRCPGAEQATPPGRPRRPVSTCPPSAGCCMSTRRPGWPWSVA